MPTSDSVTASAFAPKPSVSSLKNFLTPSGSAAYRVFQLGLVEAELAVLVDRDANLGEVLNSSHAGEPSGNEPRQVGLEAEGLGGAEEDALWFRPPG